MSLLFSSRPIFWPPLNVNDCIHVLISQFITIDCTNFSFLQVSTIDCINLSDNLYTIEVLSYSFVEEEMLIGNIQVNHQHTLISCLYKVVCIWERVTQRISQSRWQHNNKIFLSEVSVITVPSDALKGRGLRAGGFLWSRSEISLTPIPSKIPHFPSTSMISSKR